MNCSLRNTFLIISERYRGFTLAAMHIFSIFSGWIRIINTQLELSGVNFPAKMVLEYNVPNGAIVVSVPARQLNDRHAVDHTVVDDWNPRCSAHHFPMFLALRVVAENIAIVRLYFCSCNCCFQSALLRASRTILQGCWWLKVVRVGPLGSFVVVRSFWLSFDHRLQKCFKKDL